MEALPFILWVECEIFGLEKGQSTSNWVEGSFNWFATLLTVSRHFGPALTLIVIDNTTTDTSPQIPKYFICAVLTSDYQDIFKKFNSPRKALERKFHPIVRIQISYFFPFQLKTYTFN